MRQREEACDVTYAYVAVGAAGGRLFMPGGDNLACCKRPRVRYYMPKPFWHMSCSIKARTRDRARECKQITYKNI